MSYFPLFTQINKAVVFGGGKVALRKINAMLKFDIDVLVVAPEIIDDIRSLPVSILEQKGETSQIDADFVVCATDDKDFNKDIVDFCRENKINVNSSTGESDIFPATIKDGEITVAISTDGISSVVASYIRDFISTIPLQQMEFVRKEVKKRVNAPLRKRVIDRIFKLMLENKMSDQEVLDIISYFEEG